MLNNHHTSDLYATRLKSTTGTSGSNYIPKKFHFGILNFLHYFFQSPLSFRKIFTRYHPVDIIHMLLVLGFIVLLDFANNDISGGANQVLSAETTICLRLSKTFSCLRFSRLSLIIGRRNRILSNDHASFDTGMILVSQSSRLQNN